MRTRRKNKWREHHRHEVSNTPTNLVTPRGFAQLQSFPESFQLPKSKQLAIGVIGDAVPPLMAQRIFESIL